MMSAIPPTSNTRESKLRRQLISYLLRCPRPHGGARPTFVRRPSSDSSPRVGPQQPPEPATCRQCSKLHAHVNRLARAVRMPDTQEDASKPVEWAAAARARARLPPSTHRVQPGGYPPSVLSHPR